MRIKGETLGSVHNGYVSKEIEPGYARTGDMSKGAGLFGMPSSDMTRVLSVYRETKVRANKVTLIRRGSDGKIQDRTEVRAGRAARCKAAFGR